MRYCCCDVLGVIFVDMVLVDVMLVNSYLFVHGVDANHILNPRFFSFFSDGGPERDVWELGVPPHRATPADGVSTSSPRT